MFGLQYFREETQEGCKCAVSMINNETVVSGDKNDVHMFAYDYSFWSFDKKGIKMYKFTFKFN
mgnify:CR=1 FL=1